MTKLFAFLAASLGVVAFVVLMFAFVFALSTAITYFLVFVANYLLHVGFGVVMLSPMKRLAISVLIGLVKGALSTTVTVNK